MPPILTVLEIAAYCYAAGFRDDALAIAVGVALAEAGGDITAANEDGEHSYGLFQVNLDFWGRPNNLRVFTRAELVTPDGAAEAAWIISRGGTEWLPWSAYTRGTYLQHLVEAHEAAREITGAPSADPPALMSYVTAQVVKAIDHMDRRLAAVVDQLIVPLAEGRVTAARRRLRYLYTLAGKPYPYTKGDES